MRDPVFCPKVVLFQEGYVNERGGNLACSALGEQEMTGAVRLRDGGCRHEGGSEQYHQLTHKNDKQNSNNYVCNGIAYFEAKEFFWFLAFVI
jgi:hypothetical protein